MRTTRSTSSHATSKPFTIDAREWPLLRVTFHGPLSDNQFTAYLNEYQRHVERGERFAVVFDATHAERPSTAQRKQQAEWMRTHFRTLRSLNMGIGFVIPQLIIRMALRSIMLLQRSPSPYKVFDSVADAEAWCRQQLEAAEQHPSL